MELAQWQLEPVHDCDYPPEAVYSIGSTGTHTGRPDHNIPAFTTRGLPRQSRVRSALLSCIILLGMIVVTRCMLFCLSSLGTLVLLYWHACVTSSRRAAHQIVPVTPASLIKNRIRAERVIMWVAVRPHSCTYNVRFSAQYYCCTRQAKVTNGNALL